MGLNKNSCMMHYILWYQETQQDGRRYHFPRIVCSEASQSCCLSLLRKDVEYSAAPPTNNKSHTSVVVPTKNK